MKTVLFFFFSFVLFPAYSQVDSIATDDDYTNLAHDLCSCVNSNSKHLSPEMREAIVKSDANGSGIEKAMSDAMARDPEQAMKDFNAIMELVEELAPCVGGLEKKYEKIYSEDSETEVQKKLLKIFKQEKSCDLTYAIMKMGISEQKKD